MNREKAKEIYEVVRAAMAESITRASVALLGLSAEDEQKLGDEIVSALMAAYPAEPTKLLGEIAQPFKMNWERASDIQRKLLGSCYRRGWNFANEYADGKVLGYDTSGEADAAKEHYAAPFARRWRLVKYNDPESWAEQ